MFSIFLSVLSLGVSSLNSLFTFTSLSQYAYRKADISIVDKGESIKADYNPASRKLTLSFEITVSNSGKRDGQLSGESAALADAEDQSRLIPFDSSDIQLAATNQPSRSVIIIPKGDTSDRVTFRLDYQIGDIGRPILGKPGAKVLSVHFKSGSRPLVVKYLLDTWSPEFLQSKSTTQATFYER